MNAKCQLQPRDRDKADDTTSNVAELIVENKTRLHLAQFLNCAIERNTGR